MTPPSLLQVDDLSLTVATSAERTTLELVVDRDASLIVKAPESATIEGIEQFVNTKRAWIYRKLAEKDALVGAPVVKQFVDGEGFAYLVRSYRLRLDYAVSQVRLDRGRFVMPVLAASEGTAAMRSWYTFTGRQWLAKRVRPWAARLGVDDVVVEVKDLGYRWGSARPTEGPQRVNIHWATLQLSPSLIDYVLAHELAHLREANHTPEYWALLGKLMPGFETHKANLAVIGKNVWFGRTS